MFAGSVVAALFGNCVRPKMAVTFDDLRFMAASAGMTRLEITQSILETLKHEGLPPVYGFINGGRVQRIQTRHRY